MLIFYVAFYQKKFEDLGLNYKFVQDNESMDLLEVFEVAVDCRKGLTTFGK